MGWSEAYKLFVFWQSHNGILFIVLCVLLVLLCDVICRLLCSDVWKIPGYRGRVPPGGLHFCKEGVWRVGVDVFNFHDTGKI